MARRRIANSVDRQVADEVVDDLGLVQSAAAFRGEPEPPPDEKDEGGPSMGSYAKIVERVFDLPDPDTEFAYLTEQLKVGAGEFDSVRTALGIAEGNALRAHRLYVNAREAEEAFKIDTRVVEGALREKAVAALQEEKAEGQRSKAITEADIMARVLTDHPDEYRHQEMSKLRSRKMIEHLEVLVDLWRSKCRSLAAILAR